MKTRMFTATMLAPVSRQRIGDDKAGQQAENRDDCGAYYDAFKPPAYSLAERAGNMTRADMSRVPIILIPSTIVIAVDIAIRRL